MYFNYHLFGHSIIILGLDLFYELVNVPMSPSQ